MTKKYLFSSKCKECVLVALRLPQLQLSLCIECFCGFNHQSVVIIFDFACTLNKQDAVLIGSDCMTLILML